MEPDGVLAEIVRNHPIIVGAAEDELQRFASGVQIMADEAV
jgi:hypothetical protein